MCSVIIWHIIWVFSCLFFFLIETIERLNLWLKKPEGATSSPINVIRQNLWEYFFFLIKNTQLQGRCACSSGRRWRTRHIFLRILHTTVFLISLISNWGLNLDLRIVTTFYYYAVNEATESLWLQHKVTHLRIDVRLKVEHVMWSENN